MTGREAGAEREETNSLSDPDTGIGQIGTEVEVGTGRGAEAEIESDTG